MFFRRTVIGGIVIAALLAAGCATSPDRAGDPPWHLKALLTPVQHAVVTVINYDVDGNVSSVGSGFFISSSGILLTSRHVLEGAYGADIRTADGTSYPVTAVLSTSPVVDLIKVRVEIPGDRIAPVRPAVRAPAVADRVFVVGSPMGLEQTVSEGIVSAIREMPTGGRVLQLTAPISPGSSGGPVFNRQGEAVGVVTFQAARGQNLNFAISIDSLDTLPENAAEQSVAEWTIHRSRRTPALAASLCNRGARLSIQGEYEAALDYFKRAAETNPDDPEAWFGLGSCYVGLDRPDDAIRAYRRPIEKDPDNALAHFILAMYYKAVGQFDDEVAALSEVIRIDPANIQARFELGRAYGELARPEDQIHTLEKILDERPDHIPALIGLGAALAENGRPDEALQLLNRAHDLEPGNPMIHYNMGVMYNHLDRPADAAAAYIRAIRLSPRMAPAHYNLGLTYLAQGKPKRALDQYEILKALDEKAAGSLFDNIYPPDSAPHPEADARQ